MNRTLAPIASAAFVLAMLAAPVSAQNPEEIVAPPADLHPPINLDADTLRARFGSNHLGLKPNNTSSAGASFLPYGIDYNRESKALVMPIDRKSEWGVGVGLNMNSSRIIELSPSGVLGLQQPKRAPGITLHGRF